jgi:hypothetical protein
MDRPGLKIGTIPKAGSLKKGAFLRFLYLMLDCFILPFIGQSRFFVTKADPVKLLSPCILARAHHHIFTMSFHTCACSPESVCNVPRSFSGAGIM